MNTPASALCPLCQGGETEQFLHRPRVPVHQNLLCETSDAARRRSQGELTMCVCRRCGFIYNATFDPRLLEYGRQYENTQTYSSTFQSYVGELVSRLARRPEVRRGSVVEVGCGKGGFLRQLVEQAGPDCRGCGYDPSYEGDDSELAGRLRFHRCFYAPDQARAPADIVVSRHVIEHVPEPMTLLRGIRQSVAGSRQARVCFETPCARWILEHAVVWDFFYEHCSLFTADSLAAAFESAGFRVDSVEHVFGGQYLWLEAVPDERETGPAISKSREVVDLARRFTTREARLVEHWRRQVEAYAAAGPLVVWGGGAKGVTFANLVDQDRRWIDAVVDVNPNKQGRFLPGSAHPIIAPESLADRRIKTVMLLNPNYAEEIGRHVRSLGLQLDVVDLMHEPHGAT